MKKKIPSLFKYKGLIGKIFLYLLCFGVIGTGIEILLEKIVGILLWQIERPAFTSGDLPFLLRSWQGWTVILLWLVLLAVYVGIEINTVIIISNKILRGERIKFTEVLKETFIKLRRFVSVFGILVILVVAVFAPLAIIVPSLSITEDFVIPNFIMDVIQEKIVLKILYVIFIIAIIVFGVVYGFVFNAVIQNDMTVRQGLKHSRKLVKENWKNYIKEILIFAIIATLIYVLLFAVLYFAPIYLMKAFHIPTTTHRALIIFFTYLTAVAEVIYSILLNFFIYLKVTMLYNNYSEGENFKPVIPKQKKQTGVIIAIASIVVVVLASSLISNKYFDEMFPNIPQTYIVAHRAGGNLGNENTILALNKAIEENIPYAEIDVQRTKDNHYVINHDNNFLRCCNEQRSSDQMTLKEIKKLKVANQANPFLPKTEVATIEEMLDAAKGKIGLYIELKGPTANEQMARDVYKMVVDRDMLSEVVFIGLNYSLLEYIKDNLPNAKTGYLCFLSTGKIGDLKCDVLLLEEETATEENIDLIHAAGKEVNVWTVNTSPGITKFFASDADGIITDKIYRAKELALDLFGKTDEARVLDKVFW